MKKSMNENETILSVNGEAVPVILSIKIIQDDHGARLHVKTMYPVLALEQSGREDTNNVKLVINNYSPYVGYTGPSMLLILDNNAKIYRNYLSIVPGRIEDVCYLIEVE